MAATRRFRTEISQMSSEKKTEFILKAVADNEKLEDELKILRRQIFKLDKKIKELTDENQSLILEAATDIKKLEDENQSLKAQLEMDDAAAHTRTPSVATFTPRKYRKGTSTPEHDQGIRKRFETADWRITGKTTGRPDTPQLTGKRVYNSQQTAQQVRSTLFGRPPTPPRKTRKGGKRGKNMKTMRQYFQK